jgi:hypothetical protein
MTMPNKTEILEKATELFHQDRFRNGDPSFAITPTEQELLEGGFYQSAVSELLRDNAKAEVAEWKNYNAENFVEKQTVTEIPFSVSETLASGFYCCGTRQLSGKTNLCKHLVSKLISYGVTVFVVDPSTSWLNDSPIQSIFKVPRGNGETMIKRLNTVFDVSRLGYDERFAFVSNFCKTLTDTHLNGYTYPEMLVFEESQTYLPNGCMRSKKYSDIVDFCTVGGNYGLSFGAITQFSASVDKAIVKLAQQRFFGLTTEDNDKRYVKSFIGKKWIDDLIGLQVGEFLYQNRATIQKFQCQPFGSAKVANGYSFSYNLSMVV